MDIKLVNSAYGKDLFPTRWQNVIFINYGKVKTALIASVLGTDENTVVNEAARMGLENVVYDDNWRKYGYITAIRNNWHFLSVRQIAQLLEITVKELEETLIEDDFLYVKLGYEKPDTGEKEYYPLTDKEVAETELLSETVKNEFTLYTEKPFDFKFDNGITAKRGGERVIYNYSALYGDILLSGDFSSYPDAMLASLSDKGVTGLWMQGIISKLAYNPFSPDANYKLRLENLKKLCAKCAKYGIKIFLYLNEPRALPTATAGEYGGHKENGFSALCLGKKQVKDYLVSAVKELCESVPTLGGIITITMSENLTHCASHGKTNCPVCDGVPPQKLAAEVNNLIAEGARLAGGKVKVIANLWGWSRFCGWTDAMIREGVDMLDKSIEVMLVSEYGKSIEKGGVESEVIDYSISNAGPSAASKEILSYAAARGMKIWAKIQMNTSWECSAVPSLPVYGLIAEHLDNLKKCGVNDFMLSWTLGGYPSDGLLLATEYYGADGVELDRFYREVYGECAAEVKAASDLLSAAFKEFPFSLSVLYFAPHTMGGGEFWTHEIIENAATMVGFSYDDTEKYTVPFGEDVYIGQMEKLVAGFENGLEKMRLIGGKSRELVNFTEGAYLQFRSALNHVLFTAEKKKGFPDKLKAVKIIDEEVTAVRALYRLQGRDARIGFEASNQYYYNENTLLLKLVNLQNLRRKLL